MGYSPGNMDFNLTHPELRDGERFLTNIDRDKKIDVKSEFFSLFSNLKFRVGKQAYYQNGTPTHSTKPVFGKQKKPMFGK